MEPKQKTFIASIAILIVLVVGLGLLLNRQQATGPSKYQDFAKTLVADGAKFFGAFWCPHCQAEEKNFQMSRQDLESIGLYHECSNADRSQTKICVDNKIESYPTWTFKNGISITTTTPPTACKIAPGTADEPAICQQAASQYHKTWVFEGPGLGFSVRSDTDPVHIASTWKFPPTASATGEIPLAVLAEQIGYTLPN